MGKVDKLSPFFYNGYIDTVDEEITYANNGRRMENNESALAEAYDDYAAYESVGRGNKVEEGYYNQSSKKNAEQEYGLL